MRTAIVASLVAHAVVFAWLKTLEVDAKKVVVNKAEAAIAIEIVPFEVVIAEPAPAATGGEQVDATAASSGASAKTRRSKAGRSTTARAIEGTTAVVPETTERVPTIRIGPSSSFIDEFLENSKPLPPPPDIPGERIGDEIAAVRARLTDPDYVARASPDQLAADRIALVQLRAERDAEELKPAGGGTFRADKDTFVASVAADGSVDLEDTPNFQIYGLSGRFDVTDWAMRSRGDDPYAAAKQRFLERTFDQRVALGKRHRSQQLAMSVQLARKNVDRLWRMTTSIAERKRGLFELWDECAEDGDPELVAGGTAARRYLVGVIRSRLRGGNAYTVDEIARLDARRRSKQRFAPYP